ncbi:MAG: acyl-CoA dehydrogenase family protein [Thermoplasmataceae archaeon]
MRNDFGKLFLSRGVNYYTEDVPLSYVIDFLGFTGDKDMKELGSFVSEHLIESADFIDHWAKPRLYTWGIEGKRIDYVRISPDHEYMISKLQKLGSVRKSASGEHPWMYHFISGYLISDSGIFCTLTLTAQTAYAIGKYGDRSIREKYFSKYISHDNPWLGATFYSETQGGSDLGANNTTAEEKETGWILNGADKYFASDAGLADGAIVTAKFRPGYGVKNIALFFVPAFKDDGSMNYSIRRLKEKLGTIAVPTGEVEFHDSTGYLLGDSRKGIYYGMEILTISRLDDAIAAVGIARKSLWEAYIYANRRSTFGKKIIDHPLLLRDFLEMESELEASLYLSLYAASRFSTSCSDVPPYTDDYHYARLLSHISKNMASSTSSEITRYSMEIFGGNGFLEEFPVAKFHRDALVTSIWEGTSNIQALDMIEVMKRKNAHSLLFDDLSQMIGKMNNKTVQDSLGCLLEKTRKNIGEIIGSENVEVQAKEILKILGTLISAVLMYAVTFSASSRNDTSRFNLPDLYLYRHFSIEIRPSLELITDKKPLVWMNAGKIKTDD